MVSNAQHFVIVDVLVPANEGQSALGMCNESNAVHYFNTTR